MKRRLIMTITRIRRQIITTQATSARVRCPACGREVETLSEAQAVELLTIAGRSLDDPTASSQAHAIQTVGDGLRVCKDCIFAQ